MGKRRRTVKRAKPEEETRLLRLARELAALARETEPPARALNAALTRLGASPELLPRRAARPHKLRRLAHAWAREQACLALTELIQRAARIGSARADMAPELLAWLLLAAADALAHEPIDAVADRLQALRDFLRLPPD